MNTSNYKTIIINRCANNKNFKLDYTLQNIYKKIKEKPVFEENRNFP